MLEGPNNNPKNVFLGGKKNWGRIKLKGGLRPLIGTLGIIIRIKLGKEPRFQGIMGFPGNFGFPKPFLLKVPRTLTQKGRKFLPKNPNPGKEMEP